MPIELHGDAGQLLFDPRFAPIFKFFTDVSGDEVVDLELSEKGYVFSVNNVTTLGERYIHLSWRHLRYWAAGSKNPPRCIATPFPKELDELSMTLPNTTAGKPSPTTP